MNIRKINHKIEDLLDAIKKGKFPNNRMDINKSIGHEVFLYHIRDIAHRFHTSDRCALEAISLIECESSEPGTTMIERRENLLKQLDNHSQYYDKNALLINLIAELEVIYDAETTYKTAVWSNAGEYNKAKYFYQNVILQLEDYFGTEIFEEYFYWLDKVFGSKYNYIEYLPSVPKTEQNRPFLTSLQAEKDDIMNYLYKNTVIGGIDSNGECSALKILISGKVKTQEKKIMSNMNYIEEIDYVTREPFNDEELDILRGQIRDLIDEVRNYGRKQFEDKEDEEVCIKKIEKIIQKLGKMLEKEEILARRNPYELERIRKISQIKRMGSEVITGEYFSGTNIIVLYYKSIEDGYNAQMNTNNLTKNQCMPKYSNVLAHEYIHSLNYWCMQRKYMWHEPKNAYKKVTEALADFGAFLWCIYRGDVLKPDPAYTSVAEKRYDAWIDNRYLNWPYSEALRFMEYDNGCQKVNFSVMYADYTNTICVHHDYIPENSIYYSCVDKFNNVFGLSCIDGHKVALKKLIQ